jgi:hypothetical protein
MKRALAFLVSLSLTCTVFAGFKVKLVKPKKPEQFQTRLTNGDVIYAADLVIDAGEQKGYFYKELTPAHVIAIRLAVFNRGHNEVFLPLDRLRLIDPSGHELVPLAPEVVAQAVLKGLVVTATTPDEGQVSVSPRLDPRIDPNDPRNDPNDPRYPRYPPTTDPRTDPRYDPNDPRLGRYPNGTYGPYIRSGGDVVMIPGGGGGGGDLSQHEKALVEKDFVDKAHVLEPVPPLSGRDKFLYFAFAEKPVNGKDFTLRLPQSKGMPQEIILKF